MRGIYIASTDYLQVVHLDLPSTEVHSARKVMSVLTCKNDTSGCHKEVANDDREVSAANLPTRPGATVAPVNQA